AMAHKVGEKINFLSFMKKITPKADTAQAVDLGVKLVVEVACFCLINGIPGDSVGDFVKSLANYSKESLMRMSALVCFDGVLPLGPAFLSKGLGLVQGLGGKALEQSQKYQLVKEYIPGGSATDKLGFLKESMDAVKGWAEGFVAEKSITQQKIIGPLKNFMDVADDKLDFVAAALDMTSNYA